MVPELIMRALFTRGAFTTADAQAAAATLAAYALGLLPFVLLRNASITFLARGDTVTPVKALAVSVAVNRGLKIALMGPLAQVGLALATAVGAWVNLCLLVWFAARQRLIVLDARLVHAIWRLAVAAVVLALVLWLAQAPIAALFSAWTRLRYEAMLATLSVLGACAYIGTVLALFGRGWGALLRRRAARPADRTLRPYSKSSANHAETIAKRITAKCDGWVCTTLEFLFTFRASAHCLRQKGFKIVDVKVDMNRCPMSLIAANVVSLLGRLAPSRFLDQSDLRVTTFENDICRHRSRDLGKSQAVAIKPQAFIEQRNVD